MVSTPPMFTGTRAFASSMWARPFFRFLSVGVALTLLLLVLLPSAHPGLAKWASLSPPPPPPHHHHGKGPSDGGLEEAAEFTIPNIVHFVYILRDPTADFTFEFSHFLAIYAINHHWQPTTIYLHTNAGPDSPAVARARAGDAGKWNRLVLTHFPQLTLRTVAVPTHAANGVEFVNMEHRSDFVRVAAVHDLGGAYIDWDVHALRDARPLLRAGFRGVAGRELGGQLNSGTFAAARGGRMVALWMERMHKVYDGGWTTHSNAALTAVGERLGREPGEVLILERDAFAPGSWEEKDNEWLFGVKGDVKSNLEGVKQGDVLPEHGEAFADRWEHPERFPNWDHDWSSTYLLHAFSPQRFGRHVTGFEHISPRYVLERRSNFARAVYPVARKMYEEGLVEIDDSYKGT